ncbi:MAG: GNAT family N-acetyltransferase [Oscillospiraceae bacterium]
MEQNTPSLTPCDLPVRIVEDKSFTAEELRELYASVGWLSANYPERLKKALDGSDTVFAAWSGGRLVGLINAIDDGEITAYVHYLLVHPDYQGRGIGRQLLEKIKQRYRDYLYLILLAETPENVGFYERMGFTAGKSTPMMINTLKRENEEPTE